ncbi:MAG TPA: hypothetical protein VK638_10885 [Edaphobacter sp.]|nr:hypothetical protein [Edaphobacter sp.]
MRSAKALRNGNLLCRSGRSRLFIYDLNDGSSHLVYSANSIWEAPNWSPDGKYLIANSGGGIYKFVLKQDGTAEPQKLPIPADFQCNNDKAISPDGRKIAFSATVPPHQGSQVFLADADGSNVKLMASESPSYFHGWSPDNKTLAFVAQRNGSGQYDIYGVPVDGGAESQLTSNIHQDDGPELAGRQVDLHQLRSVRQGSGLAFSLRWRRYQRCEGRDGCERWTRRLVSPHLAGRQEDGVYRLSRWYAHPQPAHCPN